MLVLTRRYTPLLGSTQLTSAIHYYHNVYNYIVYTERQYHMPSSFLCLYQVLVNTTLRYLGSNPLEFDQLSTEGKLS